MPRDISPAIMRVRIDEELDTFFQRRIAEGQSQLADHLRRRLLDAAPDLLKFLDFTDDRVFLEPLLFSYFSNQCPSVPLAQILLGYMLEAAHPHAINVVANDEGVVDLPRVGYLKTARPGARLLLSRDGFAHPAHLLDGDTLVPYEFQDIVTVANSSIEVCQAGSPLLKPRFTTPSGEPRNVVVGASTVQLDRLNQAVAILRMLLPHYFNYLCAVTKRLVVFEGEVYSFATIRAHGIGFLCANDGCSVVSYLEDLVHQCGHMIFNSISLERGDFLTIDPSTPVCVITGTDDEGSIYGGFHGLFTQTHISQCFRACLHSRLFLGQEKHDSTGASRTI